MRVPLLLSLALIACGTRAPEPSKTAAPPATRRGLVHGPFVGDPRPNGALVWARTDAPATLHAFDGVRTVSAPLVAAHDFGATLEVARPDGLIVWATEAEAPGKVPADVEPVGWRPPDPGATAAVRIGFGGDVAGQNVCRHAEEGFPAFAALNERPIDLFVGLGDMIYADGVCEASGAWAQPQVAGDFEPSEAIEDYRAHWRYARSDPHLHGLLSRVPYVAVWDDHEVINDFGPDEPRMSVGLAAFREHNPLPAERLYRRLRLGRHLSLIVLDTRSRRDPNSADDSADAPKTMLGAAQRRWLRERLAEDATWHVIVSSVPLTIPTGWPAENGRDGWAGFDQSTGFEHELAAIFAEAREADARLVFLATDVHFAAVHRLTPFEGYTVHEVVTGPLNAGLFPTRDLDPTFHPERLFLHAPRSAEAVTSWDEARRWFNWGEVAVDADGALTLEIRGVDGDLLWSTTLQAG